MIRSYLKIALRSILKNRISSGVNIIGLSLSMVVGVLIFAYLKSNWETDHFHPFISRTFRINTQIEAGAAVSRWATCPQPIADELNKLSYVEATTTVRQGGNKKVLVQKKEISVETIFVDQSFFQVFGFSLLNGDIKQFFKGKNSVLISQEIAERLFDNSSPIGETMSIDGWGTFEVSGVLARTPFKTHIPAEIILSGNVAIALETKGLIAGTSQDWLAYKNASVYALTHIEKDVNRLSSALDKIAESRKWNTDKYSFFAQNLEDITPWDPAIQNDFHAGSNWVGILTWAFLALALTLLAAFNYTALSVVRIFDRAKEVGIRKTNGAFRTQIFLQFIIESVLLSCSALVIAYIIVLCLNNSEWAGLVRELNVFPDYQFVGILLLYTVLTGVVAGAIPALILSKFNPVDVLKSLKTVRLVQKVSIYKAILVIQFSVSIMLTIFFVILKDVGRTVQGEMLDKLPNNITVIDLKGQERDRLIGSLQQMAQFQKITMSDHLPLMHPTETCTLKVANNAGGVLMSSGFVDKNFIDIFNLKLLDGSNFPEGVPQKLEQYVLVNETAANILNKMGQGKVIGKIVSLDSATVQVIGVLEDDPFQSQKVAPAVFRINPFKARFISIKSEKSSHEMVTALSQNIWRKNFPDLIPEIYDFRHKNLLEYQTEMGKVNLSFGLVCAVVLFVSCLGIFGMANYAVTSNRMQIAIRRTFGANNIQLISSVTKPFLVVLIISGMVGVPLGWLCGNLLKDRFAEHVDLGMFNLFSGYLLVVAVALTVVVSQTYKSAFVSPINVLKSE